MRLLIIIISVFIFVSQNALAQFENDLYYATIINGDTVPMVYLKPISVVGKRTWKSRRDMMRYTRLQRDVRKVYPYAKRAGVILQELDYELALMEKGKDRRKHAEALEEKLKAQFEGDIRDMTVRQGKILIKLIDRETERTCYNVVKELRGDFSAFFWQGIARLFGSSLKYEYDVQEERDIENIIRNIESGYYAHTSL